MDRVKQQYNRELLKKDCGQRVTLLDNFFLFVFCFFDSLNLFFLTSVHSDPTHHRDFYLSNRLFCVCQF